MTTLREAEAMTMATGLALAMIEKVLADNGSTLQAQIPLAEDLGRRDEAVALVKGYFVAFEHFQEIAGKILDGLEGGVASLRDAEPAEDFEPGGYL